MPKAKKKLTIKTNKKVAIGKKVVVNKNSNLFNQNLSSFSAKLPSFDRVQSDLKTNKNLINLILGGLIVVVFGALLFNYFNKPNGDLGPSQQTSVNDSQTAESKPKEDVAKENLPGPYTVKDGDTLYLVAEKYYGDGLVFNKIAEENKISDPNLIEVGQTITLPKLEQANVNPNQPTLNATNAQDQNTSLVEGGKGGAEDQTIWGEKITGDTYTVMAEDWLSKIAGRAYGDIYAFEKIAQANNLADPNNIEVGTVLKIPR